MTNETQSLASPSRTDAYACVLLAAAYCLMRVPVLPAFDLVAYDGTYYINIAKSLLSGSLRASIFPVGYPALIAALLPLAHDGVRAAQIVSALAGCGSVILLYLLSIRFVRRLHALLAAALFCAMPLFVRLSLMTLSESAYIFWLLLGSFFFARNQQFRAGLGLGMAAITRPEALGVWGALCIIRLRAPRRLLLIAAGFIVPYAINGAIQSIAADRLVLVPKSKLFGSGAGDWKMREEMLEFETKDRVLEALGGGEEETGVIEGYAKRLPRDLLLLLRHATPIVVALALYGMTMRRSFLLALFAPLLFFPLFTLRSEPRFVLPYIPGLVLYSVVGLSKIAGRQLRLLCTALLIGSAAAGMAYNRAQLTEPVSDGFQWAKEVGRLLRNRVAPGDRIADRKPYCAFYAGGEYFEIPVAPIDETLDHLVSNDVRYLVLHANTIRMLRPQLLPLIIDPIFVRSELRYRPMHARRDVIVLRRDEETPPLRRALLYQSSTETLLGPRWSPDGEMVAFRVISSSGEGRIEIVSSRGAPIELVDSLKGIEDAISWGPDSDAIAFAGGARGSMNADIYIYRRGGTLERITTHEAMDLSPSWSGDGAEIIFCSYRTGRSELWAKRLDTGALERLTDGFSGSHPSMSPDGTRIAWIREEEGLYVLDRASGDAARAQAPRRVSYPPAWSRDGRFLAVTAGDWGKMDVYIVGADGRGAVLVTKTTRAEGQPDWSPDGTALLSVTFQGGLSQIWILTGIAPYTAAVLSQRTTDAVGPSPESR